MSAQSEQELYDKIPGVIIDTRNYSFAWIGVSDENKNIKPVSHSENARSFIDSYNNESFKTEASRKILTSTLKTRETHIYQDILNDPISEHLVKEAKRFNFQSAIFIPCTFQNKLFCILCIYSKNPYPFTVPEVKLLNMLSEDIAFTLRSIRNFQQRLNTEKKLNNVLLQTVKALVTTIEKRDPYTGGHQRRVAEYSREVAEKLKFDTYKINAIYWGGLIHDIGKISIPLDILNKPGALTKEEFEIVKAHPVKGYEIISDINFPWPLSDIILQHHERLDGSGYPYQLKGDEIIEEAKIIGICDIFDAMISQRAYRNALNLNDIINEIKNESGVKFESKYVDPCIETFEKNKNSIRSTLKE